MRPEDEDVISRLFGEMFNVPTPTPKTKTDDKLKVNIDATYRIAHRMKRLLKELLAHRRINTPGTVEVMQPRKTGWDEWFNDVEDALKDAERIIGK